MCNDAEILDMVGAQNKRRPSMSFKWDAKRRPRVSLHEHLIMTAGSSTTVPKGVVFMAVYLRLSLGSVNAQPSDIYSL